MPPGWSRQVLIDWLAQNGVAHFEALIAWEQAMHDIRERQYLPRSPCKESPQGCRVGLSNALIYIHGLWCGTLVLPFRPIVIDSDGTTLVKFGQDGAGSLLYHRVPDGRRATPTPPSATAAVGATWWWSWTPLTRSGS